jgi:hypothetical protein
MAEIPWRSTKIFVAIYEHVRNRASEFGVREFIPALVRGGAAFLSMVPTRTKAAPPQRKAVLTSGV